VTFVGSPARRGSEGGERVRSRCQPAAAAAARCGMEATRVCFCCGKGGREGGADRAGKAGSHTDKRREEKRREERITGSEE